MLMNHNPGKLDREDEKRMLPCRYVTSNGFCHRGPRCRFYHPAPGFIRSSIKVPPIPPNFGNGFVLPPIPESHQINGLRQGMMGNPLQDQRMRSSSNISNSSFGAPIPNAFRRSGVSPAYGFGNRPARTFSDFDLDFTSQSSGVESSSSEMSIAANEQHTVFTHINWREFLAPGHEPPPPIKVPEEKPWTADGEVDMSSGDRNGLRALSENRVAPSKEKNEDMPPEGSSGSIEERGESGKLTPREELQMKVKQIAKELAMEPKSAVQVMDSFFLNFDFKAAGYSSIPAELANPEEPQISGDQEQTVKMEESPRNKIAQVVLNNLLSKEKEKKEKEPR